MEELQLETEMAAATAKIHVLKDAESPQHITTSSLNGINKIHNLNSIKVEAPDPLAKCFFTQRP